MRISALTAAALIALALGSGTALANQHGNKYVHSREYLGRVYVMYQNHMALYTYARDGAGVSNCTGECAKIWPPALLQAGTKLGQSYSLIKRPDGSMQAAFRGQPLYLYSGDKKIGDINGDGIGGVWKLAKP